MLLFHKHNKSLKVINPLTSNRRFESPSVSGTLATEEDILNFTVPSVISKPVITFPANNSIDYENNISFTPYKTIDEYTGVHTGTEVEVALDNTFDNIIINESYIADSTNTKRIPVDVSNTTVYIRIRYISNKYTSPWSEPLKVKTKQFKINIPTIITPINNSTEVPKNIVITTSDFSFVGVVDEHDSTTYQVATDINFVNIRFNTTSIDKLTSIIASLNEGTTYYIRVRHNGKKYGSSDWSSTFKVSTLVPIQVITNNVIVYGEHGGWGAPYYYANFRNDGYLYFYGTRDLARISDRYIFTNSQNIQLYAKFTNVVKIMGPSGPDNEQIVKFPFSIYLRKASSDYSRCEYSATVELFEDVEGIKSTGVTFNLYLVLLKGW